LQIGNKGYYNSIAIQFYRKGTCTFVLPEKKRTFIPRDLTVNIQAGCRFTNKTSFFEKLNERGRIIFCIEFV